MSLSRRFRSVKMWWFSAGQSSREPSAAANMPLDWPVPRSMQRFEVWKYFVTFKNLGEETSLWADGCPREPTGSGNQRFCVVR